MNGLVSPLEARVQSVCLVILATVATAASLYWLRPVMIPFVLALFIALGLDMVRNQLVERARVPQALALPATLIGGVLALAGLSALVSASLGQLSANASLYADQLEKLIQQTLAILPGPLQEAARTLDLDTLTRIPVSSVTSMLGRTTSALANLLSQSLLVLIFVLFLVLGGPQAEAHEGTWGKVVSRVQTYLLSKIIVSAVTGLLVGLTLLILDVPLAMVFGLLAFLLNFIPNIGSAIATLLPLPVVLVDPNVSSLAATLAIAIPAGIQGVMGNVVEPRMMGDALDLHPISILMSLIFWGMLWGIVGMLLATPITAVLKIFLERFDGSRPVAELMAGRVPVSTSRSAEAAPDPNPPA
ncbi:MAG: AI-2E family transporter [Deltaproteobacteria bacterium]|nr:AI-2E family transporter [Deltaproteobacteria bacterium]MBW2394821.1 AI-2E family transporter [Deltaproteobacteria bacterium]